MNLSINIKSLYEKHNSLINSHCLAFNQILSICHKTIKNYNDHKKFECYCSAPTFLSGHSLYNYKHLISYLIDSLRNDGFNAYWNPNIRKIYVSWKPDDIDHSKVFKTSNKNKNPKQITVDDSQPIVHIQYHGSDDTKSEVIHDIFPINRKRI